MRLLACLLRSLPLFWCLSNCHAFATAIRLPRRSLSAPSLPGLNNYPLQALQASQQSNDKSHDDDTLPTQVEKMHKKKKLYITLWIHVLSGFLVANYVRSSVWPAFFLKIPLKVWNLVHGLSAMIFAGGIVTTTMLEWDLSSYEKESSTFFPKLLRVETLLVLPALTGSILSGVAQSFHTYDTLRHAPRHVKSALHLLFLFGTWWGLTDRRTQTKVETAISEGTFDNKMLQNRRISNVVSCVFLFALYGIMILKPGYSGA